MQVSRLSAIAEIVSSVAILITLVYLAIQTTQNTRAIEATSRQATLARDVEALYLNVANPRLFLNLVNRNMTDEEKAQLSSFLFAFTRLREANYLDWKSGAMDDETWQSYLSAITGPFIYEQPRKWWAHYRGSGFDPGFVELVDARIANTPVMTQLDDLNAFD
jgi:hypothetical protein